MKYKIITITYLNRREKARVFAKWLLYTLTLIICFMLMTCGIFQSWQPLFIIPLSMGVAMREDELSGTLFAVICGFVMDIATNNVFGFSGFFLLPSAMMSSLLVRNFIRANIVNHLWITIVASAILAGNEFLFKYFIWDYTGFDIILKRYLLPSYVFSAVTAPLVFILVSRISASFVIKENSLSGESFEEKEEEE